MTKLSLAKTESTIKREMITAMKENGGYGRRIEDQYGVGIYDTILIPFGLPVFMAEVKIVRGATFGPTERQLIELVRVKEAANSGGHVIPIVIGWKDGVYYFSKPMSIIHPRDCFSVTTGPMNFHNQLVQYYHSRRV